MSIELHNEKPINYTIEWRVINATLATEFIDGVFESFTAAVTHFDTVKHGRIEYVLTRIVEKK